MKIALIVQSQGPEYVVATHSGERYGCTLRKGKRFKAGRPVVGDRVDITLTRDEPVRAVISRVHPRRTELARQRPHGRKRLVIVANVDQLVIVASAQSPPLRPGLLDRYIVAAEHGGITPLLCFNKWEFATPEDEYVRSIYAELGYPHVCCSAHEGFGVKDLEAALVGHQSAFVGHSGVGKTSLMQRFFPGEALAIGDLSQLGRGAHTTTHARLLELPAGGTVVDTPGIREFGLWAVPHTELAQYFVDFQEHAELCRFSPCSHTHEPSCGVKDAADEGALSELRYAGYLKLYEELEALAESKYR